MGHGMLDFLYKYRDNGWYSQNGEEGVLREVLRRMGKRSGHAVEIGAHNGFYCSNAAALVDGQIAGLDWTGLMVEADYNLYLQCKAGWSKYGGMRVQCCRVDGKNINAFVKDDCDLLSLDTDGGDYDVFNGLIACPKIVIMEIDSSILPNQEGFNSDGGVGYWSGVELGLQKDYFLLCHTGNLVMLRSEYRKLFPEIVGHPLLDYERYFNRAWLKEAA